MCVKIYFFLLTFLFSINAIASDKVFYIFEEKELPDQLGTFRHVQFSLENNIDVYAAIFNNTMRATIYRQNTDNPFYADNLNELSKQHAFQVGINGGFYTTTFLPAGLFIEKGNLIRPMVKHSLLTTCIRMDRKEKIYLEKKRENCSNAFYAMQTGPLLINQGEISPEIKVIPNNMNKKRSDFFGENRRTVLAETDDHQILALVSTHATLGEIADILQNYPESFGVKKIKIAIDLDGGSSTGMYVRFKKEPFYFYEQRHVKTFVFFY